MKLAIDPDGGGDVHSAQQAHFSGVGLALPVLNSAAAASMMRRFTLIARPHSARRGALRASRLLLRPPLTRHVTGNSGHYQLVDLRGLGS